jgi:Uma2 family endonuclease
MSTTVKTRGRDPWIRVPATWGAYLRLCRARGERANPRYTFVDGRLTIVSPGASHEFLRTRLSDLIGDLLVALHIPYVPFGSVTLRLKDSVIRRGTEGDACYYLSNIDRVRGKKKLIMGRDPAPDLMVETVVSHPVKDSLLVHASLGVREVWVCKESDLNFLVLGSDGTYYPQASSMLIPFLRTDDLEPWVYRMDQEDEGALRRIFRRWVDDTLRPRRDLNH